MLSTAGNIQAQFNMQAGFSAAFTRYEKLRSIMSTYDQLVPQEMQKKDFGDPRLDKALVLGARFQSTYAGLTGGFQFYLNDLANKQFTPPNNQIDNASIRLRRITYFLGGEIYIDRLAVGATVDFNNFLLRWQDIGANQYETIMEDKSLGNRFYLQWEIPYSETHAFTIQPYIQLTHQAYDFQPVAEAIYPENADPTGDFRDKPMTIGIQFIFCNGQQRY